MLIVVKDLAGLRKIINVPVWIRLEALEEGIGGLCEEHAFASAGRHVYDGRRDRGMMEGRKRRTEGAGGSRGQ